TSTIPQSTSERSSSLAITSASVHPHIAVNSSMSSIMSQGQYPYMIQPPSTSQLVPASRPPVGFSSNVPAIVTYARPLLSVPLTTNPAVKILFQ
ncbi:hypothetical protein KI387_018654, partial [Taxus chinensis]